jgi:hypothetical protein
MSDEGPSNRRLFFSRFKLAESGGGGCRRELQISEALSSLDLRFISARDRTSIWTRLSKGASSRSAEFAAWGEGHRAYVHSLRAFSRKWAGTIDEGTELVLVDEPIYFPEIMERANEYDIPLVAACQNIESLSLAQIEPKRQHDLFRQEMDLLARVDLIISISREETVLLNNLGLPVLYFPYHPVDPIKSRLLRIREARKRSPKSGLLLIGNAENPVTREGILEVIRFWEKAFTPGVESRLIVAGFSTEKLKSASSSQAIDFAGSLSDLELDDLMTKVTACLCYQKSGAGALTRICEMLIAGVPVVANAHAARSYYGVQGLVEIADLPEIELGLSQIVRWEGNIPVPPKPDNLRLTDAISCLIKRQNT